MIEDTPVKDWDRVMDINAKGVFLGTKAAIPEMQNAGSGSIINISSQLGIVATDNSSAMYHASKGAVRILTKSTAIQYAPDNIRANSIHPGPVITAMTESRRGDPAYREVTHSRIPLGRFAEPIEIAYAVLYLARRVGLCRHEVSLTAVDSAVGIASPVSNQPSASQSAVSAEVREHVKISEVLKVCGESCLLCKTTTKSFPMKKVRANKPD